jgi:hypothetical protein
MATNQGLGHLGLINWAMSPLDKEVLQLMKEVYTAGIQSNQNDYGLGQVIAIHPTLVGRGRLSGQSVHFAVSFTLSTQEPYVCERIGDAPNEDDNECYPYVIATIKYRGKDKEWWKKRLVELEPKEKRWGGGKGQYGYPAAAAAAAETSAIDEMIEKLKKEMRESDILNPDDWKRDRKMTKKWDYRWSLPSLETFKQTNKFLNEEVYMNYRHMKELKKRKEILCGYHAIAYRIINLSEQEEDLALQVLYEPNECGSFEGLGSLFG